MARDFFYHSSTKLFLVAFSTIFDDIQIENAQGEMITVPLVYAQKEKFIDDLTSGVEYDMDGLTHDITFPKIGFELSGLNFAPERHVNPLNRFEDESDEGEEIAMYNRIPYDLTFDVFVGSRHMEDSLKIIEQIVPFFTPELTLTVRDKKDFRLETNIPIVLNSVALNVDYEGTMESRRTILWTLNFTLKGFYYPDVRASRRIKQTVMNLREDTINTIFERYTSTVTPMEATRNDPHDIIDTHEFFPDE